MFEQYSIVLSTSLIQVESTVIQFLTGLDVTMQRDCKIQIWIPRWLRV